jgi:hypothetical protein
MYENTGRSETEYGYMFTFIGTVKTIRGWNRVKLGPWETPKADDEENSSV